MKNGIYIENFKGWDDCKVHYKNDKIYYVENNFDAKMWIKNNQYHKENGPAIEYEYPHKEKFWYINGKLHREDGPAITYSDGTKSWYIDGKWISVKSQEEFERYLLLQVFE